MSSNLFIQKTLLTKPARLYIKKSPISDLFYFGKSVREDIEEYNGSGSRWTNHLSKHEIKPIHVWHSDWFYYKEDIQFFALQFSYNNSIVESKNWANLKEENGLDGGDPGMIGRSKISETRKKRKIGLGVKRPKHSALMSGEGNSMYGHKHSSDSKSKMSENSKAEKNGMYGRKNPSVSKLIKCPHCDKEGGNSAMKRWHFENCK